MTAAETAAEAAGEADKYGLHPVVWTVLALLMGLTAVAAAGCTWQAERSLRRRTLSLTGPAARRPPPWTVPQAPAHGPPPPGKGRTGGRLRLPLRRDTVVEAATVFGGIAFGVVLVGGPAGWLIGVVAGLAGWRWQRGRARRAAQSGAVAADTRTVERQLPLASDLLAACLTAGSGPAQAAEAVGRSIGGPLGDRLVRAAAELRLGAEPADVWGRFGALHGCEGLARCMERAGTAGVPPVQAVARLATECRARRSRAAAARARRAAVQVTGPLGLCFLPAFLAVGVAPVVLGLARSLL